MSIGNTLQETFDLMQDDAQIRVFDNEKYVGANELILGCTITEHVNDDFEVLGEGLEVNSIMVDSQV